MANREREFGPVERIKVKLGIALALESTNLVDRDAGRNHLARLSVVVEPCKPFPQPVGH